MLDRSYLIICVLALGTMFGGGLIGLYAARALPQHHLTRESGAVVKLAAAIVAALTSLVLALMLSAANGAYSVNAGIVTKLGADIVQLDHLLRSYGPEASEARGSLLAYAGHKKEELFPANPPPRLDARISADLLDRLADSILSLDLPDRRHTALAAQALNLTNRDRRDLPDPAAWRSHASQLAADLRRTPEARVRGDRSALTHCPGSGAAPHDPQSRAGKAGTHSRGARSGSMLNFLSGLVWPVVIVVSTVSIAVAIGVFIATRKLD